MDLPALLTIPFLHGNLRASPRWQRMDLPAPRTCWPTAVNHRGWRTTSVAGPAAEPMLARDRHQDSGTDKLKIQDAPAPGYAKKFFRLWSVTVELVAALCS